MNEDDIDDLVLGVSDLIESETGDEIPDYYYDALSKLIHERIDKFCTKERNYN